MSRASYLRRLHQMAEQRRYSPTAMAMEAELCCLSLHTERFLLSSDSEANTFNCILGL